MTTRITQRTIRFGSAFRLTGLDAALPAGDYRVETEEELLQELSFPAYRRIATRLFLPRAPGSSILEEVVSVDALELEAAQKNDEAIRDVDGPGRKA